MLTDPVLLKYIMDFLEDHPGDSIREYAYFSPLEKNAKSFLFSCMLIRFH